MKTARLVSAVLAALLAASVAPAQAQSTDPALDKLAKDWAAAFAKGDAKTLAGLYTENAVRVTTDGGMVAGREAIEKEFAANFAGPWKGASIKINLGATKTLNPDTAVVEGTYEVTGAKTPEGEPAPPMKGRYLNTIVKKEGSWLLAGNASMSPPPPATK